MKIGIISDIHLDINEEYEVLEILCDTLQKENCNGLILAGDISNTGVSTLKWLDKIRNKLGMPFWFVPGNHDMWDPEGKFKDTWQLYEEFRQQEGCLCGKAVDAKEAGILTGSVGWYDYSFGSEPYTVEDFNRKTFNERVWQDSRFVHWNEDDRKVCQMMLDEMKPAIEANQGKKITAVTHMLSTKEFCVPLPNANWDYFNAFLGSKIYGEYFEKHGVDCSIMGHVHYRHHIEKNGVKYKCACLGYHNEWPTDNVAKEIADSLQYLE